MRASAWQGIYGVFRPGVLTALMGASGAGKTTLMDVLADRKTAGRSTGTVKVNGFDKEPASFARVMGALLCSPSALAQLPCTAKAKKTF